MSDDSKPFGQYLAPCEDRRCPMHRTGDPLDCECGGYGRWVRAEWERRNTPNSPPR